MRTRGNGALCASLWEAVLPMSNTMRFIRRYLVRGLLVVFLVSLISFILVANSPVDPVRAYVGEFGMNNITPEKYAQLQSYFGVDVPAAQRYLNWLGGFLTGDLGDSLVYRRPVMEVISVRFMNTFVLMVVAWVISGVLGFVLGVIAGVRRGGIVDRLIRLYSYVMASLPTYWVGLVVLVIFAVILRWFPIGLSSPIGMASADVTVWHSIHHMVLPAVTLSLVGVASIALQTRVKMIAVLDEDYVLFARARGEGTWDIVRNHGLRNIMLPAITIQFASISEIFGGSVLVEQVFSYPGLGQTAINAGLAGDASLLLAVAIISALFVFVGNMIANILYGIIDPRIRRGAQ